MRENQKRRIKLEKIVDVSKMKHTVKSCIKSMGLDIEKFSSEAEKEEKWSLLSKAKSYHETLKGKKRTLKTLDGTLIKLENQLI